jgi:hypothetical protein
MVGQPFLDLGVFVGGIIVEDGVDDLSRRHRALHRIEEFDEFLMPVLLHASP